MMARARVQYKISVSTRIRKVSMGCPQAHWLSSHPYLKLCCSKCDDFCSNNGNDQKSGTEVEMLLIPLLSTQHTVHGLLLALWLMRMGGHTGLRG